MVNFETGIDQRSYQLFRARMLRGLLAAKGSKTGRRHVKTLMKRMGIEAL